MDEERSKTIKTLTFFFFLSLIAIGLYYAYLYFKSPNITSVTPTQTTTQVKSVSNGYNFIIPEALVSNSNNTTITTETAQDSTISQEERDIAFNYNIEEGEVGTILIPAIKVSSKIYKGSDGDKLLDQGFWHYPATNLPGNGETILLCHRRLFRSTDPRSCWNLNLLKPGDLIQLNDNTGKILRYIVTNNVVNPQGDVNIFQVSKDNYLKIISCSLENGQAGGSTHRIVIIAEKV